MSTSSTSRVTQPVRRSTPKAPGLFLAATLTWTWLFLGIAAVLGRPWSSPLTLLLFVLATIGPALMATLLTWRGRSEESLRRFWFRTLAVHRVPLRWWITIVGLAVIPPLGARLVVVGTSEALTSGDFAWAFVAVGLLAGLAEEPGWRGYGLDGLLRRLSPAAAGLIVGLVWAAWHLPLFFIPDTYQHGLGQGSTAFWTFLAGLVVQSIVYAWVYVGSGGSIAAVVLLHALGNLAGETLSLDGAETVELLLWAGMAVILLVPTWMRSTPSPLHTARLGPSPR